MATRCIDISENKKLGTVSPLALFVWVAVYIVLTALMKLGIMYFIMCAFSYILCQILFEYSPRYVLLTIRFLSTNGDLTPSFDDKEYITDETQFKDIQKVLPEV